MCFDFMTAARVVFGPGRLREVGVMTASLGRRVLVVTGRTPARAHTLLALLQKEGVDTVTFGIPREPEIDMVREGSGLARAESCDCVIGLGGGAALDAAKAIALLAANPGDVLDYLEIIGQGRRPVEPALPFIAIPTTAGTGSEVTSNSVLISPEDRVKVSLRSPLMLAKAAVVDPELTYDLPPRITATTGLDALTQLIEPFVSRKANALTDGICREGMTRATRSLRAVFERGRDVRAREDMAVAGLFGGLALANAGLGAVHGIAGPLGGMVSAPHGAL
ncbi:MAG: iron-containing alcohol dehydrogenase, partial [Actinobacteria bacterium]|nr:iron-containing alcohol dehydrogenase [Actinomycetota bacterium]